MAPPGKGYEREQRPSVYRETANDLTHVYNGHTRHNSQLNGHHAQQTQGAKPNGRPSSGHNQMAPHQSRHTRVASDQIYPAKPPSRHSPQPPNNVEIYSHKEQQNLKAIEKYHLKEKNIVREGKHAAAVDQLYENDLHNVRVIPAQKTSNKDDPHVTYLPNGMVSEPQTTSDHKYIQRYLSLNVHQHNGVPASQEIQRLEHRHPEHRHQENRQENRHQENRHQENRHQENRHPESRHPTNPEQGSDLRTSFDPLKDRHMWTMWRTAVNGRIVDEVRKLERIKSEKGSEASFQLDANSPGVYGRAIVAPPLRRFIKLDQENPPVVNTMANYGQGNLHQDQFIYYGLPRVQVTYPKPHPK
ncbi:uncharacterized protein LOC131949169 [Physella acuta]|uniref:uncharacterized protein LOC131949169 n=1 Tax=Physella acuta TaxID=109671 RepID=UPI0027DD1B1D|nr:uncharacterized protein LOC131949169 [Physella acuta]